MRAFSKMVLALGLVALMVAQAQAQRPGGGRGGFGFGAGMGGGGVMLLTNKGVQQELKVSDDQASKLEALAEELGTKQREQFQKLQDVPQEERREKMQELGQAFAAQLRKGVSDILKAPQLKRFEQIQLQQAGILAAPNMPRVQAALNLTDEQKTKFRTIMEDQMAAAQELRQNAGDDRQGAFQKMLDLRKQGNEKAMAVLTTEQKETWKELTGEPFEVRFEPGQFGGQRRPNNN
jgi:Spy/CpxP family protein refolding chaperone